MLKKVINFHLLLILLCSFKSQKLLAQNVGIGTNSPHTSAKLEIQDNNKGILIPRISIPNLNAAAPVTTPEVSLLVYNTSTMTGVGYYYWDGSTWIRLQDQSVGDHDWYAANTTNSPAAISDNIYTLGNVGIGTDNPLFQFEMHGQAPNMNLYRYDNSTTPAVFRVSKARGTQASPLAVSVSDGLGGLYFGGHNGTGWSFNTAYILSSATETFSAAGSGSNISFYTTENASNGATEKMRLTHDGNVGIGITAPTERLDVNGIIDGGNGFSTQGMTILTGRYNNGALTTLGTHYSDGGPVLGYGVVTQSGSSGYVSSSGIANLSRSALHLDADIEFFSAPASATPVGTFLPLTSNMIIKSAGNVGIGTTNPQQRLHVESATTASIRVEGDGTDYTNATIDLHTKGGGNARGSGIIMTDDIINNSWYIGRPYAAGGGFSGTNDNFVINRQVASPTFNESSATYDGAGSLTTTQNFFTIRNDGHTGIGTDSPLGLLHVYNPNLYTGNENDNVSNSIVLHGAVSNSVGNHYGGITWASGGRKRAGIASVMEHTDSDYVGLTFWTQGTDGPGPMYESMRITHSGNIGIGVTNPANRLQVGSVGATGYGGNAFAIGNGTHALAINSNAGRTSFNSNTSFDFIGAGDFLIYGGNVGLGTVSPTEKLEVNGSIKITDGTEGAGKVLVSDATGKGTWELPSAAPALVPPIGISLMAAGATCPVGGSYTSPSVTLEPGIYNYTLYSCANQIGQTGSGFNITAVFLSGSGDASGTWHTTTIGSCGHYYTGIVRVTSTSQVAIRHSSYNGSSFNVPGANAENVQFWKIN